MATNHRLVVRHKAENIQEPPGNPGRAPGPTGLIVSRQDVTGNITTGVTYPTTGLPSFSDAEPNSLSNTAVNRVALFRNQIYAVVAGGVFRFDHGGNQWTEEARFTLTPRAANRNIGLYPITITGVPYLVTAYQRGASTTWESIRFNSISNVWESGRIGTLHDVTTAGVHAEICHNNKIYLQGGSTTTMGVYNPELQTFGNITHQTTLGFPLDFAIYDGKLYALHSNTARSQVIVSQVISNIVTPIISLPSTSGGLETAGPSTTEGRPCLFVDNIYTSTTHGATGIPKMYAWYLCNPTMGFNGWGIWQIEASGNTIAAVARVEDSILTAAHRAGNATADIEPDSLWRFICDHGSVHHNDVVAEHTMIFRETGAGDHGDYKGYRWRGPQFSFAGASESFDWQWHMAYAQDKIGGGARFSPQVVPHAPLFTSSIPIFDIVVKGTRLSQTKGNRTILFELIPASGDGYDAGTETNVRFFFDTTYNMQNKLCALASPSHGTISNNTIVGIAMSSGTIYTVDWRAQDNGIAVGQPVLLTGFVAITGV